MEHPSNPHDKLFRGAWAIKEVALGFFQHYLPHTVLKVLDLKTLEICKDSFVEHELQEYFSDILYKADFGNTPGYLYVLLEHKSYSDRLVPLQLLEYMLKIWRLHLKQHAGLHKKRYLPMIVPMMLFHGPTLWTYEPVFSDLLIGPKEALAEYIPDFKYILLDVTGLSDREIQGTLLGQVVLLLFKHIRDPDFVEQLPHILAILRDLLHTEDGLSYVEMVLRYLVSAAKNVTVDTLKNIVEESLSEKEGDFVMTLAETLRKEGYEQGIEQGIGQGIEQGIGQGIEQGIEQGIAQGYGLGIETGKREGLLEGIELSLSVKFGNDSLDVLPLIYEIQALPRLKAVKEAIKQAGNLAELKSILTTKIL